MNGSKKQNLTLLLLVATPSGTFPLPAPSCLNPARGDPVKGAGGEIQIGEGVCAEEPRKPQRGNKGGGLPGFRRQDECPGQPSTLGGKPHVTVGMCQTVPAHTSQPSMPSFCVSLMS